jgi:hypothetical protein
MQMLVAMPLIHRQLTNRRARFCLRPKTSLLSQLAKRANTFGGKRADLFSLVVPTVFHSHDDGA